MFPITKIGWLRRALMATAFVAAGVVTLGSTAAPAQAQYYNPYYGYPYYYSYPYYSAYYPYYGYPYAYPAVRVGWGWGGGWGGGWRGGWHGGGWHHR